MLVPAESKGGWRRAHLLFWHEFIENSAVLVAALLFYSRLLFLFFFSHPRKLASCVCLDQARPSHMPSTGWSNVRRTQQAPCEKKRYSIQLGNIPDLLGCFYFGCLGFFGLAYITKSFLKYTNSFHVSRWLG